MTRANTEQLKHTPWFAKAGAACSIVPIARFVGPEIFALKGGGYLAIGKQKVEFHRVGGAN
jgi:type IV secretion system protein VirB4